MSKIITHCPSCENTNLNVVKIECSNCHTTFEGEFEIPALLRLHKEDLNFILDFVKCSGSLKEMAAKQKVSYPTLRNKLNALIEILEQLTSYSELDQGQIIKMLEEGSISALEAAKLLQHL